MAWSANPNEGIQIGLSFLQQLGRAGYSACDVMGLLYESVLVDAGELLGTSRMSHSKPIAPIDPEVAKRIVVKLMDFL